MAPVIRIDDENWEWLQKKAAELDMVFSTPNQVLKAVAGLGNEKTRNRNDVQQQTTDCVEITLGNPSSIEYTLFPVQREVRRFFPGYKVPFELETDVGVIRTWVTAAPKGTPRGDPDAGTYIRKDLWRWYRAHPRVKQGTKVLIAALEPMEKYRMSIIRE